jgi:hypothetical protein
MNFLYEYQENKEVYNLQKSLPPHVIESCSSHGNCLTSIGISQHPLAFDGMHQQQQQLTQHMYRENQGM